MLTSRAIRSRLYAGRYDLPRAFPALYAGTRLANRLALAFAAGACAGLLVAVIAGLIVPGSLIYIGPHYLPYPA